MAKRLTNKQQRLIEYNQILTKNKAMFKSGQSITRDTLVDLFSIENVVNHGSYQEIQRANLNIVAAQGDINRLLRESGLYLRSKGYYSHFKVLPYEQTKEKAASYSSEVDRFTSTTDRIIAKMEDRVSANTWGTYNKVPKSTIDEINSYSPSKRHKRALKRINQL